MTKKLLINNQKIRFSFILNEFVKFFINLYDFFHNFNFFNWIKLTNFGLKKNSYLLKNYKQFNKSKFRK